jgi:hypothetical protein
MFHGGNPGAVVDRPISGGYVSRDYPFREIGNRGFGSSVDKRSGSRLDKSRLINIEMLACG